jgi:hypothetical protein
MRDYMQKVNKITRNPSAEELVLEYQRAPLMGPDTCQKHFQK